VTTDTAALYLALKRRDTPFAAKFLVGFIVCYALSPIDLIPDFIPVFGVLDDILLLPLFIALAVKLIPSDIMVDCRKRAVGLWTDGKPGSLLSALPVFLIWLVAIMLIVKLVWY
jgi:uncharacterized membrane protein YkvA (DUF1232 family)